MIKKFVSGPINLLLFLIADGWRVVIMLCVSVLLIIASVVPAIYIRPFWIETRMTETRPFKEKSPVDVLIMGPARLIPGRTYVLQMELLYPRDRTPSEANVRVSINKNQPYLNFDKQDSLPIVIESKIPLGETTVNRLPFNVSNIGKPREPVELSIDLQVNGKKMKSVLIIPVDYYSVSIISVFGFILPIVLVIIRSIFKVASGP